MVNGSHWRTRPRKVARPTRVALRIVVQFGVRELGRRDLFQHLEGRRADTVEEQVECGGFRGAESVKNRDE